MKTASTCSGVVFAKEDGIAFINLPRKQIWIPAKGLRIGDRACVTVQIDHKTVQRKVK